MKTVAEKLIDWALLETDASNQALYAKSAYNRYYYACFYLTISELHKVIGVDKRSMSHDSLGKIIRGSFKTNIKSKIDSSPVTDKSMYKDILEGATKDWARIVGVLQEARHEADYNEKAKILKSGNEIILAYEKKQITISDTAGKIATLIGIFKSLELIYNQIGIA